MIILKVLPLSCLSRYQTFSSRKAKGFLVFRILEMAKKRLPLGSSNPNCLPAIENDWQGHPPISISWSGTDSGGISVISPEGCAAILWKNQSAVNQAAENLGIRADVLKKLGIIDKIIPEPPGGAHIDYEQTFNNVDKYLNQALKQFEPMSPEERLEKRYQKFRKMGAFTERWNKN